MGWTSDDRDAAAKALSSQQESTTRLATGAVDAEEKWKLFKGRAARAVAVDTDIAFHFLFLLTNRARVAAQDNASLLSDMILASEGTLHTQPALPSKGTLPALANTLADQVGRGVVSSDSVARVVTAAKAYAVSALPSLRAGKRLQAKGAEAKGDYATAKAALALAWDEMLRLFALCERDALFTASTLQAAALAAPSQNVETLANTDGDTSTASDHVLRVLAGAAALETLYAVASPSSAGMITLRTAMATLDEQIPSWDLLSAELQRLEGPSAADVRDRCTYLAENLALLDTLSSSVSAALERVGSVSPVVGTGAAETLLAYAPSLSASTKRTARDILDGARFQGFDRAESFFIECRVDEAMALTEQGASFSGRIKQLAPALGDARVA